MKELAALAYRDTTKENREFWRNEMGSALREIQETYDKKLAEMRGELETHYNLKVSRGGPIFTAFVPARLPVKSYFYNI